MWIYILASQKNGTLYVGVTSSLAGRLEQHLSGKGSRFVAEHRVHRLVYAERIDSPLEAIAQEKRIKRWRRAWKIALIERANPDWNDLRRHIHFD